MAQIEATVTDSEVQFRPRRQLLVTVDDGSDTCVLRFFNFYPSQQKPLAVGARVRVRGELQAAASSGGRWCIPTSRPAGGELPQALTPVYSTMAGLPQAYLRKARRQRRWRGPTCRETLPPDAPPAPAMATALEPARGAAVPAPPDARRVAGARWKTTATRPGSASRPRNCWRSSCRSCRRAASATAQRAPVLRAARRAARCTSNCWRALPFELTGAQQRVGEEIARDLQRDVPMHRLLQGDVGSGKTVVAALAAAHCIDAGYQCALMAPTEILAEQHFRKLIGWLEPLLAPRGLRVAWLTGSQKKKERDAMLALVESGEAALVIGTHAVIQEKVQFKNLALAIIDEQHRFGVAQRLALRGKRRERRRCEPHLLMMSRHADPAHAGHELLRRPGRLHHRRTAARPHAHRHQAGRRAAAATR